VSDSRFDHFPSEPKQPEAKQAFLILSNAHESASSFLDAYDAKDVGEADSDIREDLLRAMLMFGSAGLDSMAKQLIKDALPQVIQLQEGARENLREFVERRLTRDDRSGQRLIAIALSAQDPRSELINELIHELVGASLQSAEELSRLAAYFDIPTSDLIADRVLLNEIFETRNQIAHELDVDFSQEGGHRQRRDREQMLRYTTELFRIAEVCLRRSNSAYKPRRPEGPPADRETGRRPATESKPATPCDTGSPTRSNSGSDIRRGPEDSCLGLRGA
jgi:hypothetical protein